MVFLGRGNLLDTHVAFTEAQLLDVVEVWDCFDRLLYFLLDMTCPVWNLGVFRRSKVIVDHKALRVRGLAPH